MVLSAEFLIGIVVGAIRLASPLTLAALGEIFTERSGVLNLGIEGMMLIGAFSGYVGCYFTGNPWVGVIAGMIGGGLMALLFAFVSVTLQTNQVVNGLAVWILGLGLSSFLFKACFGVGSALPPAVKGFESINIPVLSQIPVLGPILFHHNILVYLMVFLLVISWIVLFRTTLGLKIVSCGENPKAADVAGVNPFHIRYLCTIFGGMLAGLGGAYLTLAYTSMFLEGLTAGRGWIVLALVILSSWNPSRVLWAGLLFGGVDAIQLRLQAIGIGVPYQFLLMTPYILTIIIQVGLIIRLRVNPPESLGKPYKRE